MRSARSRLEFLRPFVMPAVVVAAVVAVVMWAAEDPLNESAGQTPAKVDDAASVDEIVARVNAHLARRWQHAQRGGQTVPLQPAAPAVDLTVLRRLSLALHGTVPSLEEIRQFEGDNRPRRLQRWTLRLLNDRRFADYFAERLARSLVGAEGGAFIVYRRDRFVQWLSAQLQQRRRYDAIVRDIVSAHGLWTGTPSTNFMTSSFAGGKFDVNKLAGRTVRVFLGQRIDCAQCHDHPFDDRWKQHHFEGLAAFFGQVQLTVFGVEDKTRRKGKPVEYVVTDRITQKKRTVAPAVPFGEKWLPAEGSRRQRLARWITHAENRRFVRATVNRIWTLLFGRPYTAPHYAVDDLPNPDDPEELCDTRLLDILGEDFRDHGYDLRRLILVITSCRAYRLSSRLPFDSPSPQRPAGKGVETKQPEKGTTAAPRPGTETADAETTGAGQTSAGQTGRSSAAEEERRLQERVRRYEENWAVFPLTQLRPEQVIGSMIQTASLKTIDRNSHLFVRFVRFIRERDFIEEYGDPGGEELTLQTRTIPQALLLMNGKLTREIIKATPFSSTGRIAGLAGSPDKLLEVCFLVGFTRRPTAEERRHWRARLQEARSSAAREKVVEDLFWALFNSPEFSWNH